MYCESQHLKIWIYVEITKVVWPYPLSNWISIQAIWHSQFVKQCFKLKAVNDKALSKKITALNTSITKSETIMGSRDLFREMINLSACKLHS